MTPKDKLRALATEHGIQYTPETSTRDLMDLLRDRLGTSDPTLNLDPMKAKDLKSIIDWASPTPFAKAVEKYAPHEHVLEPKLDGARVRIVFGATANSIPTGRRSTKTFGYIDRAANFPHVQHLVVPELAGTILDAEVLMPPNTSIDLGPKKGFTQGPLNTVMSVLASDPEKAVLRQQQYGNAEFHVFDILAHMGQSLQDEPLSRRRVVLEGVIRALSARHRNIAAPPSTKFPFHLIPQVPFTEANVQTFLDAGYEGGMVKRLDGQYLPGKRGTEWLKIKRMSTGDFYIIGSNPGTGKNAGKVGSLRLAYYQEGANDPNTGFANAVYCADARGFDDATCNELTDPVTGQVKTAYLGKVVEVMGQGRTKNDRIRHPHFVRFRDDKAAADCDRSQLELFEVV